LGAPMLYLANFGELRPNHWHMGFDLRTNQKENLPVFAAANGYVAHIGIRALSFGRFMIINHPNGYSTLYAHLNEFYPKLEKFIKEKQKEKESWSIELDFSEKMFEVKKGDTIAKSGNTGGSQGPHLHFEILDTKTGRSLNTSLFGFAIKDNRPPVVKRLAIYGRSTSTYLQTPQLINAVRTDSGYNLKPKKILTGYRKLSFAVETFDQVNGSSGKNGIYGATLYFDNSPQIQFLIDNLNYQESDYVNAHIDRKLKNNGGPYLQHLARLPGFKGKIYTDINGTGIIELNDTTVHSVKIEIVDADENLAELFFDIQFSDSLAQLQKRTTAGKRLMPGMVNIIEEKEFEAFMPENCFYDTLPSVYFKQNIFLPAAVSAQHRFNDPQYPVHAAFTVRIKPTIPISISDREKFVMQREWQGISSVKKAQWQNGWLAAAFGDFGNFQLFIDKTPPQLTAPVKEKDTMDFSSLKKILLRPDDNSGIKSFRAELDGKWLMFTNDKAKDFVYVFDEQCPYGVHELKVRAEDIVGNITEKTWWFKRYPYTAPPPKKKAYKKRTVANKKPVTKSQ
jgi:murein DD-endopeptidase MepM/ murein hydrolase activator NlpD